MSREEVPPRLPSRQASGTLLALGCGSRMLERRECNDSSPPSRRFEVPLPQTSGQSGLSQPVFALAWDNLIAEGC